MDKVIVFDFSGVLVDDVDECTMVAEIAAKECGIKVGENFHEQQRAARKFVLHADDYYVISKALEENIDMNFKNMTIDEYNTLVEKFGFLEEFHKKFYEVRHRLMKEDVGKWFGMHRSYPNIMGVVKELKKYYPVFIGTAKNRKAIIEVLDYLGFGDVFDEDKIITKELSKKKADQMNYISEKFSVPLNKILFVEDMVQNALATKKIGVNVAVVAWGYSDERQRQDIKESGVPILENDEVYEQLKEIMVKM
ncbi:HAD family hydrolase [Candidatus Aenigmatarchaeota archaeon]